MSRSVLIFSINIKGLFDLSEKNKLKEYQHMNIITHYLYYILKIYNNM